MARPVATSPAVNRGHRLPRRLRRLDRTARTRGRPRRLVENVYDPNALGENEGASDFERNLVRFRGEGRWGFAVKRPRGVVKITLARRLSRSTHVVTDTSPGPSYRARAGEGLW